MIEIYHIARNGDFFPRPSDSYANHPWTAQFRKLDRRDLWEFQLGRNDILAPHVAKWLMDQGIDYVFLLSPVWCNIFFKTERDAVLFKLFFA